MKQVGWTIAGTLLLTLLLAAPPVAALERIYLVRHAEKLEPWPDARELSVYQPLSEAGTRRAAALATRLAERGIATIYASETTRAVTTGIPLALAADLPLVTEPASSDPQRCAEWLAGLGAQHVEDRAVLIIGHSNTIPRLLQELGAVASCYDRLDISPSPHGLLIDGYDDLFVVSWPVRGCESITREPFLLEP